MEFILHPYYHYWNMIQYALYSQQLAASFGEGLEGKYTLGINGIHMIV